MLVIVGVCRGIVDGCAAGKKRRGGKGSGGDGGADGGQGGQDEKRVFMRIGRGMVGDT